MGPGLPAERGLPAEIPMERGGPPLSGLQAWGRRLVVCRWCLVFRPGQGRIRQRGLGVERLACCILLRILKL